VEPRYAERQYVPLWSYPALFLGTAALLAVPLAFAGPRATAAGLAWAGAICLIMGLTPLLARQWIRVDGTTLRVGRQRVPLDEVRSARIVDGSELAQIRRELLQGLSVSTGSALSPVVNAVTFWRDRRSVAGAQCLRWQLPALLLETPELPTTRWLIGTRRPDELLAAVTGAVSTGR
jgi:hypothetical protein